MTINPLDRFETAADWIRASASDAPEEWIAHMATICKKRKGVWTILKTRPRGDATRGLVWDAWKFAQQAHQWQDMSGWTEGTTAHLIEASEEDRKVFEFVSDTALMLAQARSIRLRKARELGRIRKDLDVRTLPKSSGPL